MSNVQKNADFNLAVTVSSAGLTDEQIAALKKRLVNAQVSLAADKTTRQIRFAASKADIDNSIDAAVKLEQSESEYTVKTTSDSGTAKTDISMSSKGDASYRSCLVNFLIFVGIIAFLAIVILVNKK